MMGILAIINRYRKKIGWSEYQLAEQTGLPQSTISSLYKKTHGAIVRIFGEDMRRLWHYYVTAFCMGCRDDCTHAPAKEYA